MRSLRTHRDLTWVISYKVCVAVTTKAFSLYLSLSIFSNYNVSFGEPSASSWLLCLTQPRKEDDKRQPKKKIVAQREKVRDQTERGGGDESDLTGTETIKGHGQHLNPAILH